MRPGAILKQAEEMGVDRKWALNCRKRYLAGEMFDHQIEFAHWSEIVTDDPKQALMHAIWAVRELDTISKIRREIKNLDEAIARIDDEITDEMIQQARDYPIERLIEFHKGAALAWCHADKTPSLTWDRKRNKAKCWPCNKSFDTIAVLMERDNLTFRAAVRELGKG